MDYIKIEDIPEEFVGLANFMGIDKFIEFCNEYGGIAIYFPSKTTLLRNGRNREIIKMYNVVFYEAISNQYLYFNITIHILCYIMLGTIDGNIF